MSDAGPSDTRSEASANLADSGAEAIPSLDANEDRAAVADAGLDLSSNQHDASESQPDDAAADTWSAGLDGLPAVDATDSADAVTPPGRCDRSKPFGVPVLVNLPGWRSGITDGIPRLSPDELHLYFTSTRRPDTKAIFHATRPSRDAAFTDPALVTAVDSNDYDVASTVTGDGLTMYFETFRTGNFTIYTATRPADDQPWSPPALFSGWLPAAGKADGGPFVTLGGDALYTHTNRVGDGRLHIFRAARGQSGAWGENALVTTALATSSELLPVASADELTLLYASDRVDGAKGGLDIWLATRTSTEVPFTGAVNVDAVNSALDEAPGWISPDSCSLYLERHNNAEGRIYVAHRAAATAGD